MTVAGTVKPLEAGSARWRCEAESFTMEADAIPEELQKRAIDAIRFGIEAGKGFHLVAVGSKTVAMERYIDWLLNIAATQRPPCCDWCYVMNFQEPTAPRAIELEAGQGRVFRDDMRQVIEDLRLDVPRAFEAEPYEEQRNAILERFGSQRDEAFNALQQHARDLGFTVMQTPAGLAITPVLAGQPISPEAYQALEADIKQRFENGRQELSRDLERTMRAIRDLEYQLREALRELDRGIAGEIVEQRFAGLEEKYRENEAVISYFAAVKEDIVANIGLFRGMPQQGAPAPVVAAAISPLDEFVRRYEVNLIADHGADEYATVLFEENPNYGNLIGRIERRGVMGTLVTDFTMVRPGVLPRANGGFLVLDLRDVLAQPLTWEALKHALQQGAVRIEDASQFTGLMATASLEPEPIPLDVKVVLMADAALANSISVLDADFNQLFKVRCEFHATADRDDELTQALASYFVALRDADRPALDASGVAMLIEHSSRLAGDQRRLSVELHPLTDIAREAMQIASAQEKSATDREAVAKAVEQRRYRARYADERLRQMLLDRTIMVDTEGDATGQINGLTVLASSGFGFGLPVRITARAFAGRGGIVDIEREVELGGPIHSKGVFILSGYVGGQYGRNRPLSLSASLVFEQSYNPVEGDSASLAELCALLSSLAGLPARQDLAVTGSVNQHGAVQAIGGINEKVEGFFDLCAARGLTGSQGVVFPAANVPNLMLRGDVVDAVDRGEFFLYPVATVDEAIQLFTGVEAGEPGAGGEFPPGSVHRRVAEQLAAFAEATRELEASRPG